MDTLKNVKISLRSDDLSNWISANPVLLDGEVAIAIDEKGYPNIKIGNGTDPFNSLLFIHQKELSTELLKATIITAQSIAQGVNATATPYGFASGAFISANANFSQAIGINSETSAGHDYSFVYNGDDSRAIGDYYGSHGKGTFNINPKDGLSGFYIGEENLHNITKTYVDSAVSSKTSLKISEDGGETFTNSDEILFINIDAEKYHQLVKDGQTLSNAIYEVAYNNEDCFGERLINVGEPLIGTDAATKNYVDSQVQSIHMPSKVSELQNDIGYLSAHQSLSDYYTKEEVDEISAVLDGKSSIKLSIPENDVEQDLSVLNIVKLSRTKYQELESTGDLISSNLYVVEVEHNDIIFGGNSFTC